MVIERENLFDENGLPKKPMMLLNLPYHLRKQAIKGMTLEERIRLAALSDEFAECAKSVKLDNIHISVKFNHHYSSVLIMYNEVRDPVEIIVTGRPPKNFVGMKKQEIAPWCDDEKSNVENTIAVSRKLKMLFNYNSECFLHLNLPDARLLKTLLVPEFQNCQQVQIHNKKLRKETINKIMDATADKRFVNLLQLKFPLNYDYEKVFGCESTVIGHAEWVTLEHIQLFRDKRYIVLSSTNFNHLDLVTLLQFWVDADFDMFRCLIINPREKVESFDSFNNFGMMELVGCKDAESISVLGDNSAEEVKYFMIMSNSTHEDKKYRIAVVKIEEFLVHILAEPEDKLKNYIEIMKLINIKHEKSVALRGMEDSNQWNMRNVLVAQDMELQKQLETLGVEFMDGKPRLVKNE